MSLASVLVLATLGQSPGSDAASLLERARGAKLEARFSEALELLERAEPLAQDARTLAWILDEKAVLLVVVRRPTEAFLSFARAARFDREATETAPPMKAAAARLRECARICARLDKTKEEMTAILESTVPKSEGQDLDRRLVDRLGYPDAFACPVVAPPEPPPPAPIVETRTEPERVTLEKPALPALVAAGGAVVALVAMPLAFHFRGEANAATATLNASPLGEAQPGYSERLDARRSNRDRAVAVAVIGGAGVAAAIGGVVWWALSDPEARTVIVAPAVAGDAAAVVVAGTWP